MGAPKRGQNWNLWAVQATVLLDQSTKGSKQRAHVWHEALKKTFDSLKDDIRAQYPQHSHDGSPWGSRSGRELQTKEKSARVLQKTEGAHANSRSTESHRECIKA